MNPLEQKLIQALALRDEWVHKGNALFPIIDVSRPFRMTSTDETSWQAEHMEYVRALDELLLLRHEMRFEGYPVEIELHRHS